MKPLAAFDLPLSGTQLVEASAGTGKTYTIASLYLRLVLESGLTVTQILVVTYTRAATGELRDRIRRRLAAVLELLEEEGQAEDPVLAAYLASRVEQRADDMNRLRAAIVGFDEAAISTIHGFCQRALADAAFESGAPYDVVFVEDQRPLLREVVQDYWANTTYESAADFVFNLQGGGVDPQSLFQLAQKLAFADQVPVLPAHTQLPAAIDPSGWEQARDAVVAAYRQDRAFIGQLLLQGPALNRNMYRASLVEQQLLPLLAGLARFRPGQLPARDFERLLPDALARATKKGHTAPAHPVFEACAVLHREEQRFVTLAQGQVLHVRRVFADFVRDQLSARKSERGVQGFDDLLTLLDQGLRGPGGERLLARIQQTYGAALIDEFQDTDPLQYRIFGCAFGAEDRALFLIGDPKQAIYGFRGADIFAYLTAARAARESSHTLERNYRSDPGLVHAVNALFGRAAAPFLFADIAYRPVEPAPDARERVAGALIEEAPLQFLFAEAVSASSREWVAECVAAEIVQLLQSESRVAGEPIAPAQIAVLCRTNREALEVQQALLRGGVPSVLEGDSSVFDAPVAEELQRVLSAMAYPDEPRRMRAAMVTSLCGVDGENLYTMEEDDLAFERWAECFNQLHQLWSEQGFIQAFHHMLTALDVQGHLLSLPDGERRMTDLLHLAELLHTVASRQRLGPLSLLSFLSDMRADKEARGVVAESAQLRLESDAHAVRLTTVHRSKGLEYPVVFCPFLWGSAGLFRSDEDGLRFHDPEDQHQLKIDLGSSARGRHLLLSEAEALAEGLRLLYVALTRAKHRCFVVWGRFAKDWYRSALGYLLHASEVLQADELPGFWDGLKKLKEPELRGAVEALAARAPQQIGVRPLRSTYVRPFSPAQQDKSAVALVAQGEYRGGYSLQSFSSLTARTMTARRLSAGAGADRDHGTGVEALELADARALRVPLADLSSGARMGNILHHLYEKLDFFQADEPRVLSQAEASLRHYDEGVEWAPALARSVLDCLATPLDESGLQLCQLRPQDRLSEMEFSLCVGDEGRALLMSDVADVFAAHAASLPAADYADRLRELEPVPFFGFLRGFVDLLFRHRGRYYVVDYKSNLLGPSPSHYVRDALLSDMLGHHYLLQYHLYLVALDRHLSQCMPDYDYDHHVAGAYYLFLRGMAPGWPSGTGVFVDRPSRALIADLGALFQAGGPQGREVVPKPRTRARSSGRKGAR